MEGVCCRYRGRGIGKGIGIMGVGVRVCGSHGWMQGWALRVARGHDDLDGWAVRYGSPFTSKGRRVDGTEGEAGRGAKKKSRVQIEGILLLLAVREKIKKKGGSGAISHRSSASPCSNGNASIGQIATGD